jgi:hypothetical protein
VTILDRPYCDRCGEPLAAADTGAHAGANAGAHAGCTAALALEPPRFCGQCRRRLKVQVLPAGWTATCVEHGEITS